MFTGAPLVAIGVLIPAAQYFPAEDFAAFLLALGGVGIAAIVGRQVFRGSAAQELGHNTLRASAD